MRKDYLIFKEQILKEDSQSFIEYFMYKIRQVTIEKDLDTNGARGQLIIFFWERLFPGKVM